MSRTLVIGDIHGGYKALVQVLQRAEVTPEDKLIFLGDYVDGWSQSPQVIDLLLELDKTNICIFLKGNHEGLFLDWLSTKERNVLWEKHGGMSTIESYENLDPVTMEKQLQFFHNLKYYYKDDQNRLFVHGGFTNLRGVEAEFFQENLLWDRTLWEMVLSLDISLTHTDPFYPQRLKLYHEIYIGHTPVTNVGFTSPTNRANVWNMDTGAAFKGCVSILNVESKEYWQSDSLVSLYPNEIGRN
ncbi:metallophosphoesterase family protein [Myroides sp. LJL115]